MDSRALTHRKILLIVGGGIAAYKALELVRLIAIFVRSALVR